MGVLNPLHGTAKTHTLVNYTDNFTLRGFACSNAPIAALRLFPAPGAVDSALRRFAAAAAARFLLRAQHAAAPPPTATAPARP